MSNEKSEEEEDERPDIGEPQVVREGDFCLSPGHAKLDARVRELEAALVGELGLRLRLVFIHTQCMAMHRRIRFMSVPDEKRAREGVLAIMKEDLEDADHLRRTIVKAAELSLDEIDALFGGADAGARPAASTSVPRRSRRGAGRPSPSGKRRPRS